MKYEVLYETPKSEYSSEHSYTHTVEANDLASAVSVSLLEIAKRGQLTLTGIDLTDLFRGLDRDFYEKGRKTDAEFIAEIKPMIQGVRKADR